MAIEIAADGDGLADLAAAVLADRVLHAGSDIGLAGGGTPRATYHRLARHRRARKAMRAWTTDERPVPIDHPESNAGMILRTLFAGRPDRLLTVAQTPVPEDNASAFEHRLATELPRGEGGPAPTTVVLGLGDDGHTASLFPGVPLPPADRDFTVVSVPDRGIRYTATPALLARAGLTVFIVSGTHKAPAVRAALDPGSESPAARVARAAAEVMWLLDRDAARLL